MRTSVDKNTPEDWSKFRNGDHYFSIVGPEGKPGQFVLHLSSVGRSRRCAQFSLMATPWNFVPEAAERFCDDNVAYWLAQPKRFPKNGVDTVPGNQLLIIEFLAEDTGLWLWKGAQIISDQRNLYDGRFKFHWN